MRFLATADTDIGITKRTNQDSVLLKHAMYEDMEVLMAIVCDGMGGLAKGELASATVIRTFSNWFDTALADALARPDLNAIGAQWSGMLKAENAKIRAFSAPLKLSMGTTFCGMLMINDRYLIANVGDSRAYRIDTALRQLTEDQTFVAREIKRGNMTPEQAKVDRRRNMLLQCVGASPVVEPALLFGSVERGVYMLCSDGFRHEISPQEIYGALCPAALPDAQTMQRNGRMLIELVKQRQETDNISVVLIKAA